MFTNSFIAAASVIALAAIPTEALSRYVCMYVYMYVYLYMYVYVCLHVSMYNIYVYMYVCIQPEQKLPIFLFVSL